MSGHKRMSEEQIRKLAEEMAEMLRPHSREERRFIMDIVERLRDAHIRLSNVGVNAERLMHEAADEIERLQEAKRRALAIADERSKENCELRQEVERLRAENEELRDKLGDAISNKA